MARSDRIEEALKLASEAQERCILLLDDLEPLVVLPLKQYRGILAAASRAQDVTKLTEDELLEKINREIAEWRQSQSSELRDYDLSQFRLDLRHKEQKPAPQSSEPQQPGRPRQPEYPNSGVELPVVPQTQDDDEYHLEPLS